MGFDRLDRTLRRLARVVTAWDMDPLRRTRPSNPDDILLVVDAYGHPLDGCDALRRDPAAYLALLQPGPGNGEEGTPWRDDGSAWCDRDEWVVDGSAVAAGSRLDLLLTPRFPLSGPWITIDGVPLAPGAVITATGRTVGLRQPLGRLPRSLRGRA